jgi:hypothetical protein
VDIELASLAGPLELEGSGSWAAGGAFKISGNAQAGNAELAGFLRGVCAEQRGERCFFRYSRGTSL